MTLGKWAHLGHRLGECWRDDSRDLTYVHVPKNASSFVKGVLIGARGHWHHSETLVNGQENLVILRDPIDRWCSGIVQYQHNTGINLHLQETFETVTFDDHTELQTYFLQGVDLDRTTFMMIDSGFRDRLQRWMDAHGYVRDVGMALQYNASSDDHRGERKDYYTRLVSTCSGLAYRLQEHFADDYKLIESVKFYD